MANEWRIFLSEVTPHVNQVFERIGRTRETVIVETEDYGVVTIQPGEPEEAEASRANAATDEDYQAFLAAAGSWRDVDTDKLIADIHASRESSRSPVDL